MPPTFWIIMVSLAVYQFLTEGQSAAFRVAPITTILFLLGVPSSLVLFFYVALTDPGRVPARVVGASGVEELMRKLEQDDGCAADFERLCLTTWVLKGRRTKYCKETGACVDEFDHFCGWLNVAIGKGNHRPFIFLAVFECLTQFTHFWLCFQVASDVVPLSNIPELPNGADSASMSVKALNNSAWFGTVAQMLPITIMIMFVHAVTAPLILCLASHQIRLVGVNLTTNEMMNVKRYAHFWDWTGDGRRVFKNPFHKGTVYANCMDFWWLRRRGDLGPVPVKMDLVEVRNEVRRG